MRHGRCRRRYRYRARLGPVNTAAAVCILGLTVALVSILSLSARISPLIAAIAVDEVNNEVQQIINRAVECALQEQTSHGGGIVSLTRDEQGAVTAVIGDMKAINALRTKVSAQIIEEINEIDLQALEIPVGNLTGIDLFSGRGPALQIKALWIGTVSTALDHEFTAAGINQTLDRMLLQVTVPAVILLPTGQEETNVNVTVCIAESVIVGGVPETYIQLKS